MADSIGDLSFKFIANLTQWEQDIARADRLYMDARKRWEKPVAIGAGSSVGGSGGGGAGVTGPSITGTSSSDVAWNLRAAVANNQARQDRITTMTPGNGWTMPNRVSDIASGGASSTREYSDSGATYGGGMPGISSVLGAAGSTKINMSKIIRGTVYGLVADAVAGMASSSNGMLKDQVLAGYNQNSLAMANVTASRNILGSVPLVGGILSNIYNAIPGYGGNAIETSLGIAQQREDFQSSRYQSAMQGVYGRRAGASTMYGSSAYGYAQKKAATDAAALQARNEYAAQRAEIYGKRPITEESQDLANYDYYSGMMAGVGVSIPGGRAQYFNAASVAEREQTAQFNAETARGQAGIAARFSAQQAQNMIDFTYEIQSGQQEINRMKDSNALRPIRGAANYEVGMAMADTSRYMMQTPTPEGNQAMRQSFEMRRQTLIGYQADIAQNILSGSGMTYNPYIQSTMAFMNRSPENPSEAMNALADALRGLENVIKGFNVMRP